MTFFDDDLLLSSGAAKRVYTAVADLPVIDYHCHLNEKDIAADKKFTDIGELWLAGDHYKWRAMRLMGIDEEYITGGKSFKEKFFAYASIMPGLIGNPLYYWTHMELKALFGITQPLDSDSAEEIWDKTSEMLPEMSVRSLLKKFKVEYIATTDDPCDDLKYHKLLREEGYDVKVVPSFRTDNLVNFAAPGFKEYVKKLGAAAGMDIRNFDDYKKAICKRLDYFCSLGCKFSDVGVEGFPKAFAGGADNAAVNDEFAAFLKSGKYTGELEGLIGNLYVFLAREYAKRGMVMQLHLCVTRNSNDEMLEKCGRDSGFDCVGENVSIPALRRMLNMAQAEGGLPKTIIYSLNPTLYYELITLCGAFRGVVPGISWWFNDHKRGITELLAAVAELSSIDSLAGMLTDSRSFLSYPRHDYFRRILCEFLANVTPVSAKSCAVRVAKDLSYFNARKLTEEKK